MCLLRVRDWVGIPKDLYLLAYRWQTFNRSFLPFMFICTGSCEVFSFAEASLFAEHQIESHHWWWHHQLAWPSQVEEAPEQYGDQILFDRDKTTGWTSVSKAFKSSKSWNIRLAMQRRSSVLFTKTPEPNKQTISRQRFISEKSNWWMILSALCKREALLRSRGFTTSKAACNGHLSQL